MKSGNWDIKKTSNNAVTFSYSCVRDAILGRKNNNKKAEADALVR
jgi:hypothetical protein